MNLIYEGNAEMLFWEGLHRQGIKPSRQALRKARSPECAHFGQIVATQQSRLAVRILPGEKCDGFHLAGSVQEGHNLEAGRRSNWGSGYLNHR